jgi:hypothetical protein
MFLRLAGRHPDRTELSLLSDAYYEQLAAFDNTKENDAAKFVAVGESKVSSKLSMKNVAALTVVAQSILNLDATIVER